jgi:hypothetical protein
MAQTEAVLIDRMERIQEESAFDDIIYRGHMLVKERHPENPAEHFTEMIECLKEITDKGDTDIMFLREEASNYGLTAGEISRLCDAIAGELGEAITILCKTTYVIAPLTKFDGCPLNDTDVEEAGGVVAYGNLIEGSVIKYDGYFYTAVDEKLETNPYYTIKCVTLMPS